MHTALVFLIALGFIILVGLGIYFFTHQPAQIPPSAVTNISLVVRSNQWFITWSRPTTGSDPMGYIYVIQGVTVPGIVTQGNTSDPSLALNKSSYTPSNDYLITIIPRNATGNGPEASFLFTSPISA